ncbi:MAG: HAD family phosphatase [Desulfuromonadales bacterium]|nr:HAD family phosphatase [Desulfuromonadales bacterium]NIR34128.1 HAD family phosphatase [Desulfuromonadales bacterium]NIS41584.1 HAD family phosphatase [Desulfuromonadales bacterium]
MLKAVIFDFDGIIADTEPLHYRAFLDVLEPEGLSFSWERYLERYIGFDDRDMFRTVYADHGKELSHRHLSELIGRKTGRFMDAVEDGVAAYPGVVEMIDELGRELPLALCSGALLCDIEPIMNRLGLFDLFAVVVSAEQVRASKPDPESYRLAVRRLQEIFPDGGIIASRCLAIEDTPAGIESALGAGVPTLAVTNSFPEAMLGGAHRIVSSLVDLRLTDLESVLAGYEKRS